MQFVRGILKEYKSTALVTHALHTLLKNISHFLVPKQGHSASMINDMFGKAFTALCSYNRRSLMYAQIPLQSTFTELKHSTHKVKLQESIVVRLDVLFKGPRPMQPLHPDLKTAVEPCLTPHNYLSW